MTNVKQNLLFVFLVLVVSFSFGWACEKGGELPNGNYTVGGTVSGLEGNLVLLNNGGDPLSISSDGAFTFSQSLTTGQTYSVTIESAPSGQSCSVSNGSGTLEKANVTNVQITCSSSGFTVGGTLNGLVSGKIFLQLIVVTDSMETVTLETSSDGSFTFTGSFPDGSNYGVEVASVTVNNQICTVGNDSGTIDGANVTNVTIDCIPIILLFATDTVVGSDIQSRANADSLCEVAAASQDIACSTDIRGFISIDQSDEIRDMPANYSVPTGLPIYSKQQIEIQSDWASLLGGSILSTLSDAQITDGLWWSGSTSAGALAADNCGSWQVGALTGQTGINNTTGSAWIESANSPFCSASTPMLCLCY